MRNANRSLLAIPVVASLSGCIFSDTGIEVYSTQECGFQHSASTGLASGITGHNQIEFITIDDEPVIKRWCLSPDEAVLMQFPDSWIRVQILADIAAACHARALELKLGQDNCIALASVAYSGPCPGESEWCEIEDANDEVGVPDMPPG